MFPWRKDLLKHLITSKIKLINSALIWGFFVFITSPTTPSFADSPNIVNIGVATKGKYLVMNARLIDGFTEKPEKTQYQSKINFSSSDLEKRYLELTPQKKVDLVTIGCPQASLDEIQRTADYLTNLSVPNQRLWVFTSSINFDTSPSRIFGRS